MTAREYMEIEVKERSFEKILEEYEPVGVTFPSISCFEDCSILPINDEVTTE